MAHTESGKLSNNEYILPESLWPKSNWEVERGVQTPSHTFIAQQPNSGLGSLIVEFSRSHTIRHTHTHHTHTHHTHTHTHHIHTHTHPHTYRHTHTPHTHTPHTHTT